MTVGARVGEWTVLDVPIEGRVLCRCSCGLRKRIQVRHLRSGQTHRCEQCRRSRTWIAARARSRLTDEDIRAMRRDRAEGVSYADLAERYGVTYDTAYHASTGRTFRHV